MFRLDILKTWSQNHTRLIPPHALILKMVKMYSLTDFQWGWSIEKLKGEPRARATLDTIKACDSEMRQTQQKVFVSINKKKPKDEDLTKLTEYMEKLTSDGKGLLKEAKTFQ